MTLVRFDKVGAEARDVVGIDDELNSGIAVGKHLGGGLVEGAGRVCREPRAGERYAIGEGPDAGEHDLCGEVMLCLDGDGWIGHGDREVLRLDDKRQGCGDGGKIAGGAGIVRGDGVGSRRQRAGVDCDGSCVCDGSYRRGTGSAKGL